MMPLPRSAAYSLHELRRLNRDIARGTTSVMPHIVLLVDSIFDNGAYTSGDPDAVIPSQSL